MANRPGDRGHRSSAVALHRGPAKRPVIEKAAGGEDPANMSG